MRYQQPQFSNPRSFRVNDPSFRCPQNGAGHQQRRAAEAARLVTTRAGEPQHLTTIAMQPPRRLIFSFKSRISEMCCCAKLCARRRYFPTVFYRCCFTVAKSFFTLAQKPRSLVTCKIILVLQRRDEVVYF
jgi:hypothetical protein